MSMKWECWGYKNGRPEKMVYVTTSGGKDAAIAEAWERFRNLGFSPEKVTAK